MRSAVDLKAIEETVRSNDFAQTLNLTEEYIDGFDLTTLHGNESQQFIRDLLPKLVNTVLGNTFADAESERHICTFLKAVVSFVARAIHAEAAVDAVLLDILAWKNQPFFRHVSLKEHRRLRGIGSEAGNEAAAMHEDSSNSSHITSLFADTVNQFARDGGVSAIQDIVKASFPLAGLPRICILLEGLCLARHFFSVDFIDSFTSILPTLGVGLAEVSDEDFKVAYKHLAFAFRAMALLCRVSSLAAAREEVDRLRLEMAMKGLRSPYLERRLTGLAELTDMLNAAGRGRVSDAEGQSDEVCGAMALGQGEVCDWLVERGVLEEMFVRNLHSEVLRRSVRILQVLAARGRIGSAEVQRVWGAAAGKHESIQKQIYEVLWKMAEQVQQPRVLLELLRLVKPLPAALLTSQHIDLVRRLSAQVIQMGEQRERKRAAKQQQQQGDGTAKEEEDREEAEEMETDEAGLDWFLGLDMLWRMMQSECRFSQPSLHFESLCCFIELIEMHCCRTKRAHFFQASIDNLKAHASVPQSLTVMTRLFTGLASKRKKPEVDWSDFGSGTDEHMLLAVVLDDLQHYCAAAKEAELRPPRTPRTPRPEPLRTPRPGANGFFSDVELLQGVYSHQAQVERRLSFLGSLMELQGVQLGAEHVDVLWTQLVTNALSPQMRDHALAWFENLLANTWTRGAMLGCAEHLFRKHVCGMDLAALTEVGFSTFRYTMKFVNCQHQWFQEFCSVDGQIQMLVKSTKLIGSEHLWHIAVGAGNESVARQANAFLHSLIQSLSEELHCHVAEKREEYISTCMRHVLDGASKLGDEASAAKDSKQLKHHALVCRCIQMLKSFLAQYEHERRSAGFGAGIESHRNRQIGDKITLRLQKFGEDGPTVNIQVQSSSTLRQLRADVAKSFQEEAKMLRMIARGAELKMDSKTMTELRLSDGDTVHYTRRTGANQDSDQSAEDAAGPPQALDDDPHTMLSHRYFGDLFKLLETRPSVATQIWDLLMVLPTNKEIWNDFSDLQQGSWQDHLATTCPFKLLYALQIIERFLAGGQGDAWRDRFVKAGGLAELLRVLLAPELTSKPAGIETFACVSLLLNLLHAVMFERTQAGVHFFDVERRGKEDLNMEQYVHGLLAIMSWSAKGEKVSQTGATSNLLHMREEVVQSAMRLLTSCAVVNTATLSSVYTYPDMRQWIVDTMLDIRSAGTRLAIMRGVQALTWQKSVGWHAQFGLGLSEVGDTVLCTHPNVFFLKHLLPLVSEVQAGPWQGGDFFELLNELLQRSEQLGAAPPNHQLGSLLEMLGPTLDQVAEDIVKGLRAHGGAPKDPVGEEAIMHGALHTLQALITVRPALKVPLGCGEGRGAGLVGFLFHECLFDVSPSEAMFTYKALPKCKTARTRAAALDLMLALVRECAEGYAELMGLLLKKHSQRELRPIHLYRPWQMDKAQCGYVGLRNLGATCYMNSLLQQLFFIPEFRDSILHTRVREESKNRELMFQLQTLFGYLQESDKQFFETKELCQAYTDYDGKPVNTSQQMDVDEYFNMLFDKLDEALKGTEQEGLLKDCFGGAFVNQIICRDSVKIGDKCYGDENPFKSEREETFFTLSLEVKHKKSILESLDLFVEGEVLEGDNKYFCEEAGAMVDAVKRVCIKSLPKTLILHLKRFEFDFDFMKKVKLNDSCEFPAALNMEPYTLAGLERRERVAKEAVEEGVDPAKALEELELDAECEYQLVGVLVHTGTADCGHYYSYIKERTPRSGEERRWHLFNDAHVEAFDDKEIGAACYGGCEVVSDVDAGDLHQRSVPKSVPRTYNAYMLFYERVSVARAAKRVRVPIPEPIAANVWRENLQFCKDKCTFDPAYFAFVYQFCALAKEEHSSQAQTPMELDPVAGTPDASASAAEDDGFGVLQLAVRFVMDTVLHSLDAAQFASWVALIRDMLPPHEAAVHRSRWLLDAFAADSAPDPADPSRTPQGWLPKALLSCRIPEVRGHLASLLALAVHNLAPFERRHKIGGAALPYCNPARFPDGAPAEAGPDQHPDPLLTDVPFPRAFPGGYEAAEDGEEGQLGVYQAFPPAAGTVGRFLDAVLGLLPQLPQHWRHVSEYLRLLAEVAALGAEEKAFLLSRRAIARCVDAFLNEESPLAPRSPPRPKMGDSLASPCFFHLMDLVAALLCSTRARRQGVEGEADAPSQLLAVGPLDEACLTMVHLRPFVLNAVSDEVNPPRVKEILVHSCWNDAKHSLVVMTLVCECVEHASDDEIKILFDLLLALLSLRDSCREERAVRFVQGFTLAVVENTQHPQACVRCLDFLALCARSEPSIRRLLVRSVAVSKAGARGREAVRWLEACILRCDVEGVRVAAEHLVASLALLEQPQGSGSGSSAGSGEGSRGGARREEGAARVDELSRELFRHLLLLADYVISLAEAATDVLPGQSPFRLVSFLRAMWRIVRGVPSDEEGWFKGEVHGRWGTLRQLLERMYELGYEVDANKAELMRLLLVSAQGFAPLLNALTDESSGMWETLLGNFVMIRPLKSHMAYNRANMPVFYRLLLLCCEHSPPFLAFFMQHRNSFWAVANFVCGAGRYAETAAMLVQLVEYALQHGEPELVESFRRNLALQVAASKQLAAGGERSMALLARLAPFAAEGEHVAGLLESNALDAALTLCAQSGEAEAADRPSAAEKVLLAVLHAAEAAGAEGGAVKRAVRGCRGRGVAVRALLRRLSGPQVEGERLQVCAELCRRLCQVDAKVCGATAVEELQSLYGAASPPKKLTDVVLGGGGGGAEMDRSPGGGSAAAQEKGQGKGQGSPEGKGVGAAGQEQSGKREEGERDVASAQGGEKEDKSAGGRDEREREEAGADSKQDRAVGLGQWGWRTLKGSGGAQSEGEYFGMLHALCLRSLCAASLAEEGGEVDSVIRFVLSCALDALSGPAQHRREFAQLLAQLLAGKVLELVKEEARGGDGGSMDGSDEEEGSCQQAEAARGGAELMQAAQREPLAIEWGMRVLLAGGDVLGLEGVGSAVAGLLRVWAAGWSSQEVESVCRVLVLELTRPHDGEGWGAGCGELKEVALAAGGGEDGDGREGGLQEAERVRGMARALAVMAEVPVLLRGLEAAHGEGAAARMLMEALEASGVQAASGTWVGPAKAIQEEVVACVERYEGASKRLRS